MRRRARCATAETREQGVWRGSASASWRLSPRRALVQRQVEQQDVDHRFAEEAELASLGVRRDELANGAFREPALPRDARHLKRGGGRADVRVETRGRSRHQIDRHRHAGLSAPRPRHVGGDAIDQLLVGRPEVRPGRRGGVVAGAGRRRPRVEVAGRGERLADDARADQPSVASISWPLAWSRKQHLRDAGDGQRIGDAEQHGRDDGHQRGGPEVGQHVHLCSSGQPTP